MVRFVCLIYGKFPGIILNSKKFLPTPLYRNTFSDATKLAAKTTFSFWVQPLWRQCVRHRSRRITLQLVARTDMFVFTIDDICRLSIFPMPHPFPVQLVRWTTNTRDRWKCFVYRHEIVRFASHRLITVWTSWNCWSATRQTICICLMWHAKGSMSINRTTHANVWSRTFPMHQHRFDGCGCVAIGRTRAPKPDPNEN